MKVSGFLALAVLAFALAPVSQAADDDGLNWLGDYRQALREAKQTNKPLLVEFRCEA